MASGHREQVESAPGVAPWPLVGRDAELVAARRALDEQGGVVITGEAGTGKTRLGGELVGATIDEGLRWHVVRGSVGASRVPLGAWSHLLPDTWEPAADDLATWRLLTAHLVPHDGVAHLFVDDAQWLDPMTAGLVHHLVTTRRAKAVVTVRRHDGVGQPITALWKDRHLARLDLEPMVSHETAAVLEAALGHPVEPRTAGRLHERSGGNVLMLRELVDAGRADGTLRLAHGAWVQPATHRPGPRLVDLLSDRIDDLDLHEQAGAALLAIAEPIRADLLDRAVTRSVVLRLVERGLVQFEREGGRRMARSTHPLLAEVLVDGLSSAQRERAIGTLVELFEAAGAISGGDVLRLALWRLDLGLPLDPQMAVAAADLALARNDFPLAEQLATAGVQAGAGAAAEVRLGESLQRQQRRDDAEAVLAGVSERLDELDEVLLLRYAVGRALALSTELGRVDDAVAVLDSARASLPDGPGRWALEARLADLLVDCGRLRAGAPFAEARLQAIDVDEVSALCSFVAGGMVRTLSGRCADALALCDAMEPVVLRHKRDVPSAIGWLFAQRMFAMFSQGDLRETAAFAEAVESMIVDDRDPTLRAGTLWFRGMVVADQGRLDEALRLLSQAAALHDLDNRRGYQAWCLATTSRAHAQRGDLVLASEALAQARLHLWPGGQVFNAHLDVAALWISALRGSPAVTGRILDEALAAAEAEGMVEVAAYLRHEGIRVGLDPGPHVDALARAATDGQGWRTPAWAAHAAALADDDGPALARVGARFAELGHDLLAAEALAEAAASHRRAGRGRSAELAAEEARRHLATGSGARTPALRSLAT